MKKLTICSAIALCLSSAAPLMAQDADPAEEVIIVTGEREQEAMERVEGMTRAITRRPRVDKPLARQYGQICVGVMGMDPAYAGVLIDRIEANARRLDIAIAGEGCRVNTLVAFVDDGPEEVKQLRKDAPWLFSTLLDYEYDRILRGSGGAHAWHSTEEREVDGKQLAVIEVGDPPRQVKAGDPFNATRMAQQIRMDMIGSVVLMERALVPGKTLQQLADYASMRSFASIDDMASDGPDTTPTILSLFLDADAAPQEMTEFDWAYLQALYRLPRTARGEQIHDAAWSEYRKKVIRAKD
ncbi:hypothetical protein P8R33_06630 [Qipengyuania sp. XHP0211]|uniref:hypothetical protein n=1 Tax=Qipengyuania sp. XHP0211 TaxID=3038079 RepID=UPI00241D9E84|nr:hypothetical protein [Qipengyuania sp. XHP0211]MDG5750772.1 hypothetical protein [Qipengyuania sp. XHP0211]